MDENEMSITRALVELKLLDKRITKKTQGLRLVDVIMGNGDVALESRLDTSTFKKESLSALQSVTVLIEHRNKIKSAIVSSNAVTVVKIGNKSYKVADAIERKNSILYDKGLLQVYKSELAKFELKISQTNVQVDANVQKLLESHLNSEKKTTADAQTFAKQFKEINTVGLFDPLDIKAKTVELEDRIDTFEAEVDLALSESNAITIIKIE